jgi:hypothetical protein
MLTIGNVGCNPVIAAGKFSNSRTSSPSGKLPHFSSHAFMK